MRPTICSWDGIEATRGKRIASRTIVDDFGNELAMRQCGRCWSTKPEDYEHFAPGATDGHRVIRWSSLCRDCVRRRAKEWWHGLEGEAREEQLKRRDEYRRTEHGKQAGRAARRKWERANRERVNANQRRYRAARRKDSGRRKAKREAERIRKRMAEERKGRDVSEIRAHEATLRSPRIDTEGAFPRLPARPLAMAIDATDARRRQEFFAGFTFGWNPAGHEYLPEAGALGLAEEDSAGRMVYAWRVGERMMADFDTVDKVLSRGRWLWWEVYNPETVRRYALTVAVRRPQAKKSLQGKSPQVVQSKDGSWRVMYSRFSTGERRFYGDRGTDWETLHEVEHAFTCEGLPYCWTCWARREKENAIKRAQRQGEQLQLAEAA